MANELYVIVGASGHVGGEAARILLGAGKRVRAVARHPDRLKALVDKGAEVMAGSIEDEAFVKKAFAGAHAVFVMIPPNFALQKGFRAWQDKVAENQVRAIEANKVPWVMLLSSVGAQLEKGTGPVIALHRFEERLKQTAANALFLRPGYFLENLLPSIGMIKQMGLLGGALRGDLPIPMIATKDIGQVAGRRLIALDWKGQIVHELLGARDTTMNEVAKAIGKAIGRPELRYQQFPYEDALKGMVGAGIPEEVAAGLIEMNRAFNEGLLVPTQKRTPETTTPTTVEQFAETVFANAFRAQ